MNEYHWAKLLQIAGFIIGTGVASVLLNREFVGSHAERILFFLSKLRNTLVGITLLKILVPKFRYPFRINLWLISSYLVFLAWILLLMALIFNVDILLLASVSFLVIYALRHIVDVSLLPITNRPHKYTLMSVLFLLINRLIGELVLFPIVFTISLFLIPVTSLIFEILKSIAKGNRLRLLFTLFGFTLILAGLILEYNLID